MLLLLLLLLLLATAAGVGEAAIMLFWIDREEFDELLMFWATVTLELTVVVFSLSSIRSSLAICSASNWP